MQVHTLKELKQTVAQLGRLQPWNHAIELPHGVWTVNPEQSLPGKNLRKWQCLRPYLDRLDLSGMRVLDVGCSDGFFSFELAKRGVAQVVGVDISEQRIAKARFVREALNRSNVEFRRMGADDPGMRTIGRFDVAVCLGLLHRVPNPYGLIEMLAAISNLVVLEWKVHPEDDPFLPTARFSGDLSVADDPFSRAYFLPTMECVRALLRANDLPWHYAVSGPRSRRACMIASHAEYEVLADARAPGGRQRLAAAYRHARLMVRHLAELLIGTEGR